MNKDTIDRANDSKVTLNDMAKYILWIHKEERDAKPNPAHLIRRTVLYLEILDRFYWKLSSYHSNNSHNKYSIMMMMMIIMMMMMMIMMMMMMMMMMMIMIMMMMMMMMMMIMMMMMDSPIAALPL